MKKIISWSLIVFTCSFNMALAHSATESAYTVNNESQNVATSPDNKLIGGWSPVFFTNYNESQVKQIIDMVKQQRISKIKITYPTIQKKLAMKIEYQIEHSTKMKPSMALSDLKDTAGIRYTHNTVIVTLYYAKHFYRKSKTT